ncbi:Probable membrane-associated kinase regulator 4 [Linum perenne]
MSANLQLHDDDGHHSGAEEEEDDYIDMEISSYSTSFLLQSMSSREFEFQMSSATLEKDHSTNSPADELFYNGKLLPLHLPPRFQMVDKILQNSSSFCSSATAYDGNCRKDVFGEFYSTPLMATPTTTSTPYDSCNISPFDSCPVSRELNPEEYLMEYSSEVNSGYLGDHNPKRSSWAKRLNLMKSSGLGSKLKAPRAYLKALFGKSGCSDESSAARVADEGTLSKASKESKKAPLGQIQKEKYQLVPSTTALPVNKQKTAEDCSGSRLHRRSFSLAIKWNSSATKTSSNSSSFSSSLSGSSSSSSLSSTSSSNGSSGLPYLKRSTSVISTEVENPIQGAIAHCKQSQESFNQLKTVKEGGFHSKIAIC